MMFSGVAMFSVRAIWGMSSLKEIDVELGEFQ